MDWGQTGATQPRGASASPGGQATSVTWTLTNVKLSPLPRSAHSRMPSVTIILGGTSVPAHRVTRRI